MKIKARELKIGQKVVLSRNLYRVNNVAAKAGKIEVVLIASGVKSKTTTIRRYQPDSLLNIV